MLNRLVEVLNSRVIGFGLILLLLAGCHPVGDVPAATETPSDVSPTVTPLETEPEATATITPIPEPVDPWAGEGPWDVEFSTSDGVVLRGTVLGNGPAGIVLAPMYPGEQSGWLPFAEHAALQGYRVLTFDLRGTGESDGTRDFSFATLDIDAAVHFLQTEVGVDSTVLVGAGQGGAAALQYAIEGGPVAGVAAVSTPAGNAGQELTESALASLTLPTLWIGTRFDMMQDAETMYEQVGSTQKDIWIYEGVAVHGTYIFDTIEGEDLSQRILDFVASVSA